MIDKDGNFTNSKINGTDKDMIDFLIEVVNKQNKKLTPIEEKYIVKSLFMSWKETGTLPASVLLAYAMPAAERHFGEFDPDEKSDEEFHLPPRLNKLLKEE